VLKELLLVRPPSKSCRRTNSAVIGECEDFNGDTVYGPTEMYYGFDAYNGNQLDALSYDIGTKGANGDGFGQLANRHRDGSTLYMGRASLFPGHKPWVMTGALQASWDSGYNGYSACWASQCDRATYPQDIKTPPWLHWSRLEIIAYLISLLARRGSPS
jgi:hypothetical protein